MTISRISNMTKGALCVNPKGARRQDNRQRHWKCTSEYTVAAGEESREAVTQRRVATDPRASDNSDRETPVIPLISEEEDSTKNNSSPTILGIAMDGDTMSLAMAALAALNACASSQGEETPIDMGLFIQWLNNSDTVRKFISGQSVPGIEPASTQDKPTQSVPFYSPKPDHSNLNTSNYSGRPDAGVAISKINAWIASLPSQSSSLVRDTIDVELLVHLFQNPEDFEKRIKELDVSYRSGTLSASMTTKAVADRKLHARATTPESPLFFPRKNTVHEHNSTSITGFSSVPRKVFSSMGTASNNMSLLDEDMVPMSPLYSSPSANWESDMKTERIINEYGTFADMRMKPRGRKSLISPVVLFSLPQTELLELPRASLLPTNGLPLLLHRNPHLPEMHRHPVLGVSAPIPMPRTKLVTSVGSDPSPRTDLVTLPKANQQPAAIMRHLPSAFGHSTPLMIPPSLSCNIQVVGQGSTMLKPEKPCIYFKTPKGCYNGANCRYLHSKSDQALLSRVEKLPNAKKRKLLSKKKKKKRE